MYERFPYPSPRAEGQKLKGLANLLKIFGTETGYRFSGKSVLDVGTGTGHRLIEAAATFPDAKFTAVDLSEAALRIARQVAAQQAVQNVQFHLANMMESEKTLGSFDMVLGMGVIHHLSDPALGLRNLAHCLADDGLIFLYVYGKHGCRERIRRKRIVSILQGGEAQNFEAGISLVEDHGFDSFEYGWNVSPEDEESRNALIVDAYLNVNETQFEIDGIVDLMRSSGLHGSMVYGVTLDKIGRLFDTRLTKKAGMLPTTQPAAHLRTLAAKEKYERLSLIDKYRLLDLFYQPNGYTLLAYNLEANRYFSSCSRILSNLLMVKTG